MILEEIIRMADRIGVMDVALPFLLIFTIVYSVLSKTKMYKKKPNMIIAFVIGMSVVVPHVLDKYPPCWDVVVIINEALPKIGLLIAGIVAFIMVLGFLGIGLKFLEKFSTLAALIIAAFVVSSFLSSGGQCYNYNFFNLYPFLKYLLPLILIGLIIWAISGKNKAEDEDVYG